VIRLSPRESQIAELMMQGYEQTEIAKKLRITLSTVKANFNRMYMRAGITDGVKRVKLAVMLDRERRG
jgi:DNA-binding NarL/FixJ family response regulator